MYEFIRIQYQMGVIDDHDVMMFVPKWITLEQAQNIIKPKGE